MIRGVIAEIHFTVCEIQKAKEQKIEKFMVTALKFKNSKWRIVIFLVIEIAKASFHASGSDRTLARLVLMSSEVETRIQRAISVSSVRNFEKLCFIIFHLL